jgi:hypothetical protein
MFADAGVVSLVKEKFVAVAIDEWYQHRQRDAEGDFYRKVVYQGPHDKPDQTTQGLYAFAPDGTLLGYTNHRAPERVKAMLEKALEKFAATDATALGESGKRDAAFVRTPPEGGFVADVTSRVLGGYKAPKNAWQKAYQEALGRDHLWVTRDEAAALERGELASSLARRIARFHLIDNTRGEPPMWRADEVRRLEVSLKDGRIAGRVKLETASGDRGFDGEIRGVVEVKDGAITRFDLVAKGEFWGEGRYTPNAPEGRFPFAVSIRLADAKDAARAVPPQGARDVSDYLRAR